MSAASYRSWRGWRKKARTTFKVIGFPVRCLASLAFVAKKRLLDTFSRHLWWKRGVSGTLSSTKDMKNEKHEERTEDLTETNGLNLNRNVNCTPTTSNHTFGSAAGFGSSSSKDDVGVEAVESEAALDESGTDSSSIEMEFQSSTSMAREGWNNPICNSPARQTNSNHQHLALEEPNSSCYPSQIHLNLLNPVPEPNCPETDNFHATNALLEPECNGIDGLSARDIPNYTAPWNNFSNQSSDVDQPSAPSKHASPSRLSKYNETAVASNPQRAQERNSKSPSTNKRTIVDEPETSTSSLYKLPRLCKAPPQASNDDSNPVLPPDNTLRLLDFQNPSTSRSHGLDSRASPGPSLVSSISNTGSRNNRKNNATSEPKKSCDSILPHQGNLIPFEALLICEAVLLPQGTEVDNIDREVKDEKKKRIPLVIPHYISEIPGDEKMFQCKHCNRKFKTKAHIKYHKSCETGTKPLKCKACGKEFNSKSHYEYHARIHTGERPYACPNCPKTFNQQGKVTRHMKVHTGEKPFLCAECGRQFAHPGSLRSHYLTHTGERPYACEYCEKTFRGVTSLKKHTITHTGERPYVCPHCGKSFGLKWTLDMHMKAHSSERPYACDQCDRAFQHRKDLRRHLFNHSGVLPFKCWICGKEFRRKDNLDRHIRNAHGQPKEVSKHLVNEAAAEYLAQSKGAEQTPPVSKENSAGE